MPHYVLHDFAKADREWLVPLLDAIADNAPLLAENKDSTFANRLHAALGGDEKPGKKAKPAKDLREKAESSPQAPQAKPEDGGKPHEGALARGLKKLFGG